MGTCITSQYRRLTCTTHFRRFAARISYGQSTRLFTPPGSALLGVFVFTLKCDSRMAAGEVPASEADLMRYRGVEPLPHTSGTGQALGPSSGKVMPKAAALGSGLQVAWQLRGRTLRVRVSCRPRASTQGVEGPVLSGPEHSPGYARTLSVSQELSPRRVF